MMTGTSDLREVLSRADDVLTSLLYLDNVVNIISEQKLEDIENVLSLIRPYSQEGEPLVSGDALEIQAKALEDAAEFIDFTWEVFTATDGYQSIRQHGRTPEELLRDRAMRLRPKEISRVEVINDSGRVYSSWDAREVEVHYQDEGRTMKIFHKGDGKCV